MTESTRHGRGVLSCDWGTSVFRLRWCDADGVVRSEHVSDRGVARIVREGRGAGGFVETLHDAAEALRGGLDDVALPSAVVVSGMASSTIGWRELPYGTLPWEPTPEAVPNASLGTLRIGGRDVPAWLWSGLASADDVMRGEETQLIGLRLAGALPRDGTAILPGTHSKHVTLRGGAVVGFRTTRCRPRTRRSCAAWTTARAGR